MPKTPIPRSGGKIRITPPAPKGAPAKRIAGAKAANVAYGPGPVSVYAAPNAQRGIVRAAIKRTNAQAGYKVLKYTTTKKAADIKVRQATGRPNRATGTFGQVKLNRPYAATSKAKARKGQIHVAEHEIGHALGLAHPGPKANPYLSKKKPKGEGFKPNPRSGIMGYGTHWTEQELRQIRQLRKLALKKAAASKPRKRKK